MTDESTQQQDDATESTQQGATPAEPDVNVHAAGDVIVNPEGSSGDEASEDAPSGDDDSSEEDGKE